MLEIDKIQLASLNGGAIGEPGQSGFDAGRDIGNKIGQKLAELVSICKYLWPE